MKDDFVKRARTAHRVQGATAQTVQVKIEEHIIEKNKPIQTMEVEHVKQLGKLQFKLEIYEETFNYYIEEIKRLKNENVEIYKVSEEKSKTIMLLEKEKIHLYAVIGDLTATNMALSMELKRLKIDVSNKEKNESSPVTAFNCKCNCARSKEITQVPKTGSHINPTKLQSSNSSKNTQSDKSNSKKNTTSMATTYQKSSPTKKPATQAAKSMISAEERTGNAQWKSFSCSLCTSPTITFTSLDLLGEHIKKSHKDKYSQWLSSRTRKSPGTSDNDESKRHKYSEKFLIGDGGSPVRFACKCGKTYGTRSDLLKHLAKIATGKLFSCPEKNCKKRFYKTCDVNKHMQRFHNKKYDKVGCRKCGALFGSQNRLYIHRVTGH